MNSETLSELTLLTVAFKDLRFKGHACMIANTSYMMTTPK